MKSQTIFYFCIAVFSLTGIGISYVLGIETGLTISSSDYERNIVPTLSVIGTWLGAFGTLSAVIVSLWLAFKQFSQNKEILECHIMVSILSNYPDQDFLCIRVVSKGEKPVRLNSVSWFSENAETAIMVVNFHPNSHPLPAFLPYGEQISIIFPEEFPKSINKYIKTSAGGKYDGLYVSLNSTTQSKEIKLSSEILEYIQRKGKC